MSEPAATERERLIAAYERRVGARPRWLDELTNEGLAWHLEQLGDEPRSDLTTAPEQPQASASDDAPEGQKG